LEVILLESRSKLSHLGRCEGRAPRQAGMSGFQQALEKSKGCLANDVVIKQELDWQRDVKK
jgi:hypothetical protein